MSGIRSGKLLHLISVVGLTWSVACGVDKAPSVRVQAVGPACTVGSPEEQWTSQPFASQTGRFHVDLLAIPSEGPSEGPIDAVIGLSDGAASWFPQLAAIVRFGPSGVIDARSGSEYQADAAVPYTAGAAYRFHVDIDIDRHVYSVVVDDPAGQSTSLARNYRFRTEQSQLAQLNNLATQVDSDSGSITICDVRVVTINTSCPLVEAGDGFKGTPFGQPGDVLVSSELVATPDETLDGVFGLSFHPAAGFNNLAAAVRLSPGGVIEARNGDHYQADVVQPYFGGHPQRMRILANLRTHTFSAFVALGDHDSIRLAQGYAFRPTQLAVPGLDTLNAIVDSSHGVMSICNERDAISVGVRSLQDGNYAVGLLPGGAGALIANDTTTRRVNGDGRTLATLDDGGQIAVDPAGNFYLANVVGTNAVIEAYTADFALRWIRSFPIGPVPHIAAIGADATSVVIGTGGIPAPGADLVTRWLADGSSSTQLRVGADAIAIGPNGFVLGLGRHNEGSVAKYSFGSDVPDWQDSWHNSAHIDAMTLAPNGNVYFGGTFSGPISFGGPTLTPQPGAPGKVYVAALSATGAHMFTRDVQQLALRGIASNGSIAAISTLVASRSPRLTVLDSTGEEIRGEEGRFPFAGVGDAGSVAMASSGRVYWNFAEAWPSADAPAYPYLVSLDPGI